MIPRTIASVQGLSWQEELSRLITDPEELISRLKLDTRITDQVRMAVKQFPLRVSESFVARMQPGKLDDPLLLQVLPLEAELLNPGNWSTDPLIEKQFIREQGLIHKYKGRVLLIATPQCAINCRYCFRRHFDYSDNSPGRQDWQSSFEYIQADPSIEEVILSGGDPLIMPDKQLQWFIKKIGDIAHVKRLRIHSRLPLVLPSRMTQSCIDILTDTHLHCVLVVHTNHPNEIDSEISEVFQNLHTRGITLLNQSVLLNNVNNCGNTLTILSKKLFACGVLPYYLHLMDKVKGATHFDVTRSEALAIHNKLRSELPGYLVPRLVEEIPGAASKTPVMQ